ncbi:hypothetical protein G9A89_022324 [Geosiphon pyriformis]|nr:hypothetical protein G9A89_022324 [Geosiphon pyriformis]
MSLSLSRRAEQVTRRKSLALRGPPAHVNEESPLDCIKEPIAHLALSFEVLQKNFEGLQGVHDSFVEFNESFSAFLYGMKMNAHCTEFKEAPTKEIFPRFAGRTAIQMTPQKSPFRSPRKSPFRFKSPRKTAFRTLQTPPVQTRRLSLVTPQVNIQQSPIPTPMPAPHLQPPITKKKGDSVPVKNFVKRMIDGLPLKYREQQPHRKNVEDIVKQLFANPRGMRIDEIMDQTKMQRVRCNEYLVALVHAKEVTKESTSWGQSYRLNPIKYPLM